MSVFGAGLLVGTALSVIIPEGISTLYMTQMRKLVKRSFSHVARLGKAVFKLSLLPQFPR